MFADARAAGLVSRTRSELDRRESLLDITPLGRDALTTDMAERDRWLAAAIAGMSETEAQVLRLAAALMERLADTPPATRELAGFPAQAIAPRPMSNRLAGFDPGLTELRRAFVAMAAVLATYACALLVQHLARLHLDIVILSIVWQ